MEPNAKQRHVQAIVDECRDVQRRGHSWNRERLCALHPELLPELDVQLRTLQIRPHVAEQTTAQTTANMDEDALATRDMPRAAPWGLRIRCPHCRAAIHVASDGAWTEVICKSCGHRVNFVEETEKTDAARKLGAIAHFELVERLGRGAYGTVWKAHDLVLNRTVAIKVPRGGRLSPDEAERFFREARSVAQLHHPGIVSVYEVGCEDDRLFIVSEFVRGMPLSERIVQSPPSCRVAAEIVRQICEALEHAHQRGVIHRDLKPANVLIDENDRPRITDFGLAKRDANEVTMTMDGHVLGTPAYMSPEQARGESHLADARSDIFSLGVILYQLLTGELPFRGSRHMVLHQIASDEPQPLRKLDSKVPRDLETICLRCMSKDPAGRYPSAQSIADELGRFLRGEPILSRPAGPIRRVARWCRRKPLQATLVAMICLLALGGPVVALRERWHARLQVELRRDADTQRELSSRRAIQAVARREEAESARNEAELAQRQSLAAAKQARRFQYGSDMLLVQHAIENDDVLLAQQLLEQHLPVIGQEDNRSFPWFHFWKRVHLAQLATLEIESDGDGGGKVLSISSDGRYAATDFSYVWIAIVDLQTQQTVARVHTGFTVTGLWVDGDTRRLVAVGHDGKLHWWDTWDDTGVHSVKAHDGAVNTLVRMPDQSGFATCGDDGQVKFWSNAPDKPTRELSLPNDSACSTICVSGDMKSIAVIQQARNPAVSVAGTTLLMFEGESNTIRWSRLIGGVERFGVYRSSRLAFSPDGMQLAYSTSPRSIMQLSTETGATQGEFQSRDQSMSWIGYSPDGEKLAGLAWGGAHVYLWDATTRKTITPVLPHETVRFAHWKPDGQLVTSGERCITVWDLEPRPFRRMHSVQMLGADIVYVERTARRSETNRFLVNANWPMSTLWDVSTGERVHTYWYHHRHPLLMPDGSTVVSTGPNCVYQQHLGDLWPTTAYTAPNANARIGPLALSPDGRLAAIVSVVSRETGGAQLAEVLLWDLEQQQVVTRFDASESAISQITFTPDNRRIMYVDGAGQTRCWDVAQRTISWETDTLQESHSCMACTNDSARVAIGDATGDVKLLEMNTGRVVQSISNHGLPVNDVAFSPDGDEMFVAYGKRGASSGEVCVWDLSTGHPTARLGQDLGPAMGISISDDEKALVSAHRNATVVFWDTATDAEVEAQRTRR